MRALHDVLRAPQHHRKGSRQSIGNDIPNAWSIVAGEVKFKQRFLPRSNGLWELRLVMDIGKGPMVCKEREMTTLQVIIELLESINNAQEFFLIRWVVSLMFT